MHILRLFILKHHCRLSRARHNTHISIVDGRGVPRPYIALLPQGYRGDYCPYRGHTCCDYSFQNIICRLSRARCNTHISIVDGRGMPRPYILCVFIGLAYFLLPTSYLRGSACVCHSFFSKYCFAMRVSVARCPYCFTSLSIARGMYRLSGGLTPIIFLPFLSLFRRSWA